MLELFCLLILSVHLAVGCVRSRDPRRYLLRMALLSAAAFVAEDSCIRMYGFYAYSHDAWSVFLDRMPVLVMLIWPGVILSSWELAQLLAGGRRLGRVALVGGLLVLADASFIEAIAVQAKLWRWFEPGFFGVPPIGVLGWAYFSAVAMLIMSRNDLLRRPASADLALLVVPPVVTHLLLVVTWWGAARWLSVAIPAGLMIALVWLLALPLTAWGVRSGVHRRIPVGAYLTRLPAALFFFVLLFLYGDWALTLYALAFVPPYVSLGSWSRRQLRRKLRN